jgi:hypothetical protein
LISFGDIASFESFFDEAVSGLFLSIFDESLTEKIVASFGC